jgi:alpha-ketoglutarate-dependent taurine dioxygenase
MNYESITVEPVAGVGAFVSGVDLNQFDDVTLVEMKAAFADHSVLFFRDQSLTPDAHIALAERWGEININRFFTPVTGYPQIAEVRKEPDQQFNIGGGWHTDHSYDQIPALGSMLYALETPMIGGDTLFASTCAAYDALSDGLKQTLEGLQAVHSSRHVFGEHANRPDELGDRLGNQQNAQQDAIHPVVITHPLSRRKSLYVNPAFTLGFEGWTEMESAPLLQYLYQHIGRPEFCYRLQWAPGTLAFWDNRATWHWAVNDYHGQRRVMHRITSEGGKISA